MTNNEDHGTIQNLTHHIEIMDAILTTLGENFAIQQALLHFPSYDGRNIPFKTFIQEVENGVANCPESIRQAFFRGVVAKL